MAKRKTKNKVKKKMPQGVKLIILFAVFLLYSFAVYFKGMGILGKFFRDITLGNFGFFGFLMPFMIFFVSLFAMNKNLKKRRAALITGVIILFIAFLLFVDIFKYDGIMKINYFSLEGVKSSFEMGKAFQSSGIIGDFFAVLLGMIIGRIGIAIVSITMIVIGVFLITNMNLRKIGMEIKAAKKRKNEKQRAKPQRRG